MLILPFGADSEAIETLDMTSRETRYYASQSRERVTVIFIKRPLDSFTDFLQFNFYATFGLKRGYNFT